MGLSITPDFDYWPVKYAIEEAVDIDRHVQITWSNGQTCEYHKFLLRENSPDETSLHPLSRETLLSPSDIPDDLSILKLKVSKGGNLDISWSDGITSSYHTGWLYAHGWFGEKRTAPYTKLWSTENLENPPTFDGPTALKQKKVFLDWLIALRDYGFARLENLENEDGLLERIVTQIGVIRESNFGRKYVLELKDVPDSNAFTSDALLQHTDMPTRINPHGLQFLFCRDNTTRGGEGIYTDAFKIAADLKIEEPDVYHALTSINWEFNNRAVESSYRATGPIFETEKDGSIVGVRYTPWLRAPLVAPINIQERAYSSVRTLVSYTQNPKYQMEVKYKSGDLFAFDNRRVLHGRKGYDAKGGTRFIEGVYSDHDELFSCIRVLKRQLAFEAEDNKINDLGDGNDFISN
ncbi:TauD/TfdA family dioxygenase [Curvivirga aplysinae]|uniref:TauD/TfdA family dioxygenase n=1 Tax=Curvivirga aplysinae TaxID=2529852 RepID=UPI0012BC9414|nr:TauD/TfdA family dioxygenase [Curvivirga aplysinae]MTI08420.1 DUF971 domain-containing protein [Curvivirga aplysinae]